MRISLEEAQCLILENVTPLAPVRLPLKNALGYVLAQDVAAPLDQPPFPRSPYDGYALRSADSAGATTRRPKPKLLIIRSVPCGTWRTSESSSIISSTSCKMRCAHS